MEDNGIKVVMDADINKPWTYDGETKEFIDYCLTCLLLKAPHKSEKGKLDDWDLAVRMDVAKYARICGISHESIARELIKIGTRFLDEYKPN